MAGGKRHYKRATQVLVVGAAASFVYLPPALAVAVSAGLLIGRFANPDVRDQEHIKNYAETQFKKKYGRMAGFLWWLFWWPLAKFIPHRNFLSHFPPIATPLAFLYLSIPLLSVAWWLLRPPVGIDTWLSAWLWNWSAVGILAGWAVQDFVHLAQDDFVFFWTGGITAKPTRKKKRS